MDLLIHKRDFMSSPYKSERDKLIVTNCWNVRTFFELLDKLKNFLEADKCYKLADNYLIAMVFTYFLRASLEPEEYTTQNFFAALLLAYNMEEDEGEYMLISLEDWLECSVTELKQLRYDLFQRMDYRAVVSRTCCEIVMSSANPKHRIWQRNRHIYHSGNVSARKTFWVEGEEDICPICEGEDSEEEIDIQENLEK